jgi:hypothetical protein
VTAPRTHANIAPIKPTDAFILGAAPVLDGEAAAPLAVPEAVELALDDTPTVVAGYAEPRAFISNGWDVA